MEQLFATIHFLFLEVIDEAEMKRRTNPSSWTVRQVSEILYCNIRKATSPECFL